MNTIQILSQSRDEYASAVELTVNGKTTARVRLELCGFQRVNVACCNAMNAVWRGAGRFFDTWEEAEAGYKSADMKSAIRSARELIETAYPNGARVMANGFPATVIGQPEEHGLEPSATSRLVDFGRAGTAWASCSPDRSPA